MISISVQQNESFDSKLFQRKQLQTNESTTNSWEFRCLCKRFCNFYRKWIQINRETEIQEGYLSIPNHTINTFQRQNVFKTNFFVIRNVKRKWKIRCSIHFLAQQKEPLNKQNSFTHYYATYLPFLERFLATTTTTQGVDFHKRIIK